MYATRSETRLVVVSNYTDRNIGAVTLFRTFKCFTKIFFTKVQGQKYPRGITITNHTHCAGRVSVCIVLKPVRAVRQYFAPTNWFVCETFSAASNTTVHEDVMTICIAALLRV
jgi:hypothetical protein